MEIPFEKIKAAFEALPKPTLEEYLEGLDGYKEIIDTLPDWVLRNHLDLCISNEWYEAAAYIRDTAILRNVKL